MPRLKINLEPYRHEIESQIESGNTQTEIREWLSTKGIHISKNAFSRQISRWKISRRTFTPAKNALLISAIKRAFHTTKYDDETIAQYISSQGIPTSQNQVKEIRLAQGWQRRGNDNNQLSEKRAQTFLLIKEVVTTIKAYGRCPSFFRSDRGKEALLLVDAHYSFYVLDQEAKGTAPEDLESLRLRDCYMFGTSTANIRIESTWMRMIRSQTKPWLVSIFYLNLQQIFH